MVKPMISLLLKGCKAKAGGAGAGGVPRAAPLFSERRFPPNATAPWSRRRGQTPAFDFPVHPSPRWAPGGTALGQFISSPLPAVAQP